VFGIKEGFIKLYSKVAPPQKVEKKSNLIPSDMQWNTIDSIKHLKDYAPTQDLSGL
jgi:hypothetical protein